LSASAPDQPALLGAVRRQPGYATPTRSSPSCTTRRPGEAIELRRADLVLSEAGWGELRLHKSNPATGVAWSDAGRREARQLKHRAKEEVRIVPAPPELVRILREHLEEFGTAPDSRLFRTPTNGTISDSVYARRWERARTVALTVEEAASPLADRPYALRHAAVSGWLNAGVDATQVAEWAGHSVHVLHRVYAKCVAGRDAVARGRIERFLSGDDKAPGGCK
jgi:integrase